MHTIILILVIIVNLILWIYLFNTIKKKFTSGYIDQMRKDVELLIKEIDKTTDTDITLLENKIEELRRLIRDSEYQIDLLKSIQIYEKNNQQAFSSMTSFSMEDVKEKTEVNYGQRTKNRAERMYGIQKEEHVEETPEETPKETPTVVSREQELSIKNQIITMHNEGFSSDIIAEKLRVSLTEINMIIDMFGKSLTGSDYE